MAQCCGVTPEDRSGAPLPKRVRRKGDPRDAYVRRSGSTRTPHLPGLEGDLFGVELLFAPKTLNERLEVACELDVLPHLVVVPDDQGGPAGFDRR